LLCTLIALHMQTIISLLYAFMIQLQSMLYICNTDDSAVDIIFNAKISSVFALANFYDCMACTVYL